MEIIILGYSLIALVVFIVAVMFLVNHNIILKKDSKLKRFLTHPLLYYSLKRIGSACVSVLIALAITFCLLRIQNYKASFCSSGIMMRVPPDQRDVYCNRILTQMGLNKPLLFQLFDYYIDILPFPKEVCLVQDFVNIETVVNGVTQSEWRLACTRSTWQLIDFGNTWSVNEGTSIISIFATNMPISFSWGIYAVILQIGIGYPLGIFMAKYKNGIVDKLGQAYIIFVDSVPGLVYFYFLMFLFRYAFKMPNYDQNLPHTWWAAILTASLAGFSGIAYWVRRYMLNEFSSDYVKFARAKGLGENRILFTHILRNAVVPLSRSFASAVISCLVGSFFIEELYGINGFGRAMITALGKNDYPLVQGILVVTAMLSVVSYLLSDLTMAIADPRISLTN